jgi:predicted transcriptional regulator of viral defense system
MQNGHKPWIDNALGLLKTLPPQALTWADLRSLVRSSRQDWQAPASLADSKIASELTKHGAVRVAAVDRGVQHGAPTSSRPVLRYLIGPATEYSVALSLRKGSYLSHASAVYAHGLSLQLPQTVYVNREQSPKPRPKGGLTQAAIDRAFQNKPRTSNYYFAYQGKKLLLLSGKSSGRYGVEPVELPTGEVLDTTNLERTLVDITVRPTYAGGVLEVLKVFREAATNVSLPALLSTLQRLDYIYPYHQAMGFYLQRAGFSNKELKGFRELGINYAFYLANHIVRPEYDADWRLYYPREIQFIS